MHQMRISTTHVSSEMLRSKELEIRKKSENCKSRRMKTKQSTLKLSQIRRRIELCPREIILRFGKTLQILIKDSIYILIYTQGKNHLIVYSAW